MDLLLYGCKLNLNKNFETSIFSYVHLIIKVEFSYTTSEIREGRDRDKNAWISPRFKAGWYEHNPGLFRLLQNERMECIWTCLLERKLCSTNEWWRCLLVMHLADSMRAFVFRLSESWVSSNLVVWF